MLQKTTLLFLLGSFSLKLSSAFIFGILGDGIWINFINFFDFRISQPPIYARAAAAATFFICNIFCVTPTLIFFFIQLIDLALIRHFRGFFLQLLSILNFLKTRVFFNNNYNITLRYISITVVEESASRKLKLILIPDIFLITMTGT